MPSPDPAGATTENNDYVFERAVKFRDGGTGRDGAGRGETGRRALDILEERFARGEIDKEEYLDRRAQLTG